MKLNVEHVVLDKKKKFALTINGELFRIDKQEIEKRAIVGWQYFPQVIHAKSGYSSYYYRRTSNGSRINFNIKSALKEYFDIDQTVDEEFIEQIMQRADKNNEELLDRPENSNVGRGALLSHRKRKEKEEEADRPLSRIERNDKGEELATFVPGVHEQSTIFNPFPL